MNIAVSIKNWHQPLMIILLAMLPLTVNAGLMVGGTRFIYHEKNESGLSVLVRNTENAQFLIQSKVSPDNTIGNKSDNKEDFNTAVPFVATPPLLQLKGKKENYIRIIRTDGILPSDRETLFQLIIASIPSGIPNGSDVQVALRSRYKLIYRPSGLKGDPNKAYQQLRWQRHGANITIENSSPYYVTLFQMGINGKFLPAVGVVAPFASRTDPWCPKNGNCNLQWQSLNDLGDPTPAWAITPNATASLGNAIGIAGPTLKPKKPDQASTEDHSSPTPP